ncbi:MAG: OmpH family outer membrane protein [Bryobacteraceae bacterium]|nr:OmpH family outer membrane protein [Bryobacteraceae bacterium]
MFPQLRRLGLLALAAAALAFPQIKVGIIDLNKAVLNTAEIKKAQAELEAKFRPRQQAMQKLEQELQKIQADLQSGKLNAQAEAEFQVQGQRKQRDLQRMSEDLQGDVDRERTDILQRSGQRMSDVVKKLAEEKGLDVVIDVSNTVFFKPALDITVDATGAYDKAYPVAAK